MSADPRPTGCPGHGRHWFSEHGSVGNRQPRCVRCGAPNPKWTEANQREWEMDETYERARESGR